MDKSISGSMDNPELKKIHQEIHKMRVRDLLSLSEEENELLVSRIQTSDGVIRVFVHPYYYEKMRARDGEARAMEEDTLLDTIGGITDSSLKKLDRIYETIPRIVRSCAEKGPPIIFFEEEPRIKKLGVELDEMLSQSSSGARAYLVPTFEDRATPRVAITADDQSMARQDEENWPLLIDQFKTLGVKKIIIGGTFLTIEKGENERTAQYNYCLGTARNELSKSFDVSLSELTFPHGRREERSASNTA